MTIHVLKVKSDSDAVAMVMSIKLTFPGFVSQGEGHTPTAGDVLVILPKHKRIVAMDGSKATTVEQIKQRLSELSDGPPEYFSDIREFNGEFGDFVGSLTDEDMAEFLKGSDSPVEEIIKALTGSPTDNVVATQELRFPVEISEAAKQIVCSPEDKIEVTGGQICLGCMRKARIDDAVLGMFIASPDHVRGVIEAYLNLHDAMQARKAGAIN